MVALSIFTYAFYTSQMTSFLKVLQGSFHKEEEQQAVEKGEIKVKQFWGKFCPLGKPIFSVSSIYFNTLWILAGLGWRHDEKTFSPLSKYMIFVKPKSQVQEVGGVDVLFSKVNLIEVVNLDRYRISFFFQVCITVLQRETSFFQQPKKYMVRQVNH